MTEFVMANGQLTINTIVVRIVVEFVGYLFQRRRRRFQGQFDLLLRFGGLDK